jgi:hypothetical protein
MKDSQRKAMWAKLKRLNKDADMKNLRKQFVSDFENMKLKALQNVSLKRPLTSYEANQMRELAIRKFRRMGIRLKRSDF